ncbi:MAG: hypothetical protein KC493_08855 [Bacteriovoracaceae bacterium]|nr:hypothetical protein [Bacteriovoracaceae bacterium]
MKVLITFVLLVFLSSCGEDPLVKKSNNQLSNNNLSCNSESGVVCGQPPMPPCPPNMFCTQVMPDPVSYENECALLQAKARMIKPGSCE